MPQDISNILDSSKAPTNIKADAWDAFHAANSPDDFKARFDKLGLPDETKAALWDAKFPKTTAPLVPQKAAPVAPKPTPSAGGSWADDEHLGKLIGGVSKAWETVNTPVADFIGGKGATEQFITRAATGHTQEELSNFINDPTQQKTQAQAFAAGVFGGTKNANVGNVSSSFTSPVMLAMMGAGAVQGQLATRAVQAEQALAESRKVVEAYKVAGAAGTGNAVAYEAALQDANMAQRSFAQATKAAQTIQAVEGGVGAGFTADMTTKGIIAAKRLSSGLNEDGTPMTAQDRAEAQSEVASNAGWGLFGASHAVEGVSNLRSELARPGKDINPMAPGPRVELDSAKTTPQPVEPPVSVAKEATPVEGQAAAMRPINKAQHNKLIKQSPDEAPSMTAEKLRSKLASIPNVGPDKADAAMSILEANATYLGKDLDTYIKDYIAGVRTDGVKPENALYQRTHVLQAEPEKTSIYNDKAVVHGILDMSTGERVAEAHISKDASGRAVVEWIGEDIDQYTPGKTVKDGIVNSLGPAVIRDLGRQYREQNPGITAVEGERITGASVQDANEGDFHTAKVNPDLFQSAKKGAVSFLSDGRAVIHAFEKADISTVVHESAHIFRRIMKPEEKLTAERWLGVQDGKWTVPHEEAFARGFEKYLREGKAPTTGLAKVFESFKSWLSDIYKKVVQGAPTLTPDARRMYDRLLGSDQPYESLRDKLQPVADWDTKNRPQMDKLNAEITELEGKLKRADQKRWKTDPMVPGQKKLEPIATATEKTWLKEEIARKKDNLQTLTAQRQALQGKLMSEALREANPGKTGPKRAPEPDATKPKLTPDEVVKDAIAGGSKAEERKSDSLSPEKAKVVEEAQAKSSAVKPPASTSDPLPLVKKAITAGRDEGKKLSTTLIGALSDITGVQFNGDQAKFIHDIANWATVEDTRRYIAERTKGEKAPEPVATTATPTKEPSAKEPRKAAQTPKTPEQVKEDFNAPMGKEAISLFQKIKNLQEAITRVRPGDAEAFSLIQKAAQDGAPDRISEYNRHFKALTMLKALQDDPMRVKKALDVAKQRGEQGRAGWGRRPYTDPELTAIAKSHADTVVTKYENMTESELGRAKAHEKLRAPMFERTVRTSADPALIRRYEDLLGKTAGAKPEDPMKALQKVIGGEVFGPEDFARMTMRERLGELKREKEQLYHNLNAEIKRWDKATVKDSLRFVDDMENGRISNDPQTAALQNALRNILDNRRDAIYGLGKGYFENYLEHYFPHLFEMNKGAGRLFGHLLSSKKPLSGTSSFLKPRDYEFFTDAIEAGLQPVTWNPVKMALLRAHDMDRFLMAHTVLETWKTVDLAKWFTNKADKPEGWVRLDDRVFNPQVKSAQGGMQTFGNYYAPRDAAKIMNNYLMPGLRGNVVYDTIAGYNNFVNSTNLGLSGFHAMEVSVDSMVGDASLGMLRMAEGVKNRDLGRFMSALWEGKLPGPFTRALTLGGSVAKNYIYGSKALAEYLSPGTHVHLTALVEDVARVGGVAFQDPVYRNAAREGFRNAWKEAQDAEGVKKLAPAAKVAYRSIGMLGEKLSAPLMEHFVPRVKLGAFMALADDIHTRFHNAPDEVITRELDKAWDSVDNRMGEVVYDNMFMDKIAKDINHLMWRSLGWNLGTGRELGGGVFDVGKMMTDKAKGQPVGKVSYRTAYTLTLPMATAYISALLMYAYTGQLPQELSDYFYPKTGLLDTNGKPERVYIKSYMQDAIAWARHPLETLTHKAAPWLSQSYELWWKNADYYGREIVHPEDNPAIQNWDRLKYLAKSSAPFSVQNAVERNKSGANAGGALGAAMFGIIPAPKWVGSSKFEQYIFDEAKRSMMQGPKTHEQADKFDLLTQTRNRLATGKIKPKDLYTLVQQGKLGMDKADELLDELDMTPIQRHAKQLDINSLLHGYNEYATPEERKQVFEQLSNRYDDLDRDKHSDEELKIIDTEMQKALKQIRK
jgi:hypothetical protein